MPKEIRDYFLALVETTVVHRESTQTRRNDMLQLLIDLRKSNNGFEPSLEEIAGNSFIFFFAGVETSTGVALYCLYELSRDYELWKKAQDSVGEALLKHNNEFTYDMVQDIKFIENCMKGKLLAFHRNPSLFPVCLFIM